MFYCGYETRMVIFLDIGEAIRKAWSMVVEKFNQDTENEMSYHWNEEVLKLHFFRFLNDTGAKIRQVASEESFTFKKGLKPDLVFSVEANGKVESAVLEFKMFWRKEEELEEDWKRLEIFKEITFGGKYVKYGYLLAFTSFDFKKEVTRINDYEMRTMTYRVPSNLLVGSQTEVAQRMMKKIFREWRPNYDIDENGQPFAFFKDHAVHFLLLKDINQMFPVIIFYEKENLSKLANEFRNRGYTKEMLEQLENEGILFLSEDPFPLRQTRYYITKIRGIYERFEKDYFGIREGL